MSLIVQKFGGSSLATVDRIKKVAKRIAQSKKEEDQVVVVVSALGNTTDRLISLAKQLHPDPQDREMDSLISTGERVSSALMAIALHKLGQKAVSLSGSQIGILTDNVHTKARILNIDVKRIKKELAQGKIVVVAGFQGRDYEYNITTLGRGGSDTTAVAIAAALGADNCEIFTDVEGVFSADPRVVPEARKIPTISYDEMLEMASGGAKVMQSRAVEFGERYNVKIQVRSSFTKKEGTVIMRETEPMEKVVVREVVSNKGEARVTIINVPDKPGVAAYIFGELGKGNVNVDMIIQSSAHYDKNDISFTVNEDVLPQAMKIMEKVRKKLGAEKVVSDTEVGKVTIVGVGMRSHPGIAGRMFGALARDGINIEMIATSEIRISCVVREKLCEKAVKALHKEFALEKE